MTLRPEYHFLSSLQGKIKVMIRLSKKSLHLESATLADQIKLSGGIPQPYLNMLSHNSVVFVELISPISSKVIRQLKPKSTHSH